MIRELYLSMGLQSQYLCKCEEKLTVGFPFYCIHCSKEIAIDIVKFLNDYFEKLKHCNLRYVMRKNILNTKDLIFDAIESKTEGENIEKIVMVFSLNDSEHSIIVKFSDEKQTSEFKIEKKDITLIKLIFINKIKRLIEKDKYKGIILQIHLIDRNFEIYLQDNNDEVVKFNY